MAQFYEMPAVSPTMELGTLVEWKVSEGEAFEGVTILAEIGTDKANMDAEIFDDGVMIKHLVAEGDEIPPGFPIAVWGESADEDISDLLAKFEELKKAPVAAPVKAPAEVVAPVETTPVAPPKPAPVAKIATLERVWMGKTLSQNFQEPPGDLGIGAAQARVKASPLARKMAADLGVNLHRLQGSGPGGRILKVDVENAPIAGAISVAPDVTLRNSPMRKTIAKRLLQSHTDIPVFFLTATFDMQGFVDLRKQIKGNLPDVRVSYNDILLKAVALALTEHPFANAQWAPDSITQKGAIDIGVAVALPAGLITPVIRNADQKSLVDIGAEVRTLAKRAREGQLAPNEYTGATFTISNLGMMQIEQFTAIINPPEVAILAVGAVEQVPVVVDGELAVGWRMKVTMSCDHRVLDGAVGAAFLQTLRRYVENPFLLFF